MKSNIANNCTLNKLKKTKEKNNESKPKNNCKPRFSSEKAYHEQLSVAKITNASF